MNKQLPAGKIVFAALIGVICFAQQLTAQTYCDATSKGAGNIYGGNITAMEFKDDSGVIYGYYNIPNNSIQTLLNPTEYFTLSSWEYFTLSMKALNDSTGKKWWSKAAVWVDLNRDGNFSATECIADPVKGPFQHLKKDTWTAALLTIPGNITAGKTRIRIRGFDNSHALTSSMGCGASNAYGNQLDLAINLFVGSMSVKELPSTSVDVYPNPAHSSITIEGIGFTGKEITGVITDMTGKLLKTWVQPSNVSNQLSIADLPNGIYNLQITNGRQQSYSRISVNR